MLLTPSDIFPRQTPGMKHVKEGKTQAINNTNYHNTLSQLNSPMRIAPVLFGVVINLLYSVMHSVNSEVDRGSSTIDFRARRRCQGVDSVDVERKWEGTIGKTPVKEARANKLLRS